MRIAISATGTDLAAQVDPRFGRCSHFVIFDPETLEHEAVDNSNAAAGGGAGIATAQMIVDKGVRAVLTGNCGPNAYQVLSAAGIQVVTDVTGTINEAIEGYKAGKFLVSSKPSVEAHHGLQKGAGI
jgi:predicted Fe-Mo cluster-binding NifX family protein